MHGRNPSKASAVAAALFVAHASLVVIAPLDAHAEEAIEAGCRLLRENDCDGACHRSHAADDDPSSLYSRETRKVQSREALHRQVELCVSRLGSMIFPEEISSVVAALDNDRYHFTAPMWRAQGDRP